MNYGYTEDESRMVIEAVVDNCLGHEEFVKFLKQKGITQSYQVAVDLVV